MNEPKLVGLIVAAFLIALAMVVLIVTRAWPP
jgi:hypothetical protein